MKKLLYTIIAILLLLSTLCSCGEDDDWAEQVAAYRAEKMATYEAENEQYADYEVDVAFLGDSLTDGYDVKRYYPQYLVSNRGIGGETTVGLEERMQVSLYDLKPKVAVMLIGANNMDEMMDNYEDLLRVRELYEKSNLVNPSIIVDTNHNNSGKKYLEQVRIAKDIVHSRNQNGDIKRLVKGLMIESYLEDGAQSVDEHVFGKSITDPCLGWEKTEQLIYDIAEKL